MNYSSISFFLLFLCRTIYSTVYTINFNLIEACENIEFATELPVKYIDKKLSRKKCAIDK